jgi:glycosyltransferase involved in cell wall biosynthesis
MKVAVVHDYLTQRGGAERVVLTILKAFPTAMLYTSLYRPEGTFPEFRNVRLRPLALNRLPPLRRHHRVAMPLLAPAFSRLKVAADVTVCSSSGWAHGVRTFGRKVVYCHTPARWLYQPRLYLGTRHVFQYGLLNLLAPGLRRWDREAASTADTYLTQSSVVRDRIRACYGIDAEVLPAPYRLSATHSRMPIAGLAPGFFLCVSRLLPYKNVDAVIAAFADLPDRLVVVGDGPEYARLRHAATGNVRLIRSVTDEQLAWLYATSEGVVAASYEDYGLTVLEAAAFGKPTAVLRWGGFLDTVREHETGIFFDRPEPPEIRGAVERLKRTQFDARALQTHAQMYSEERFVSRLRGIVLRESGTSLEATVREEMVHGAY